MRGNPLGDAAFSKFSELEVRETARQTPKAVNTEYCSVPAATVEARRFLLSAVGSLVALLDLKDQYTGIHGAQMSNWALGMTKMFDLTPQEIENIQIAATLHDIGKVGIPDAILKKDEPLEPEEWKLMKKHPEYGWAITKEIIGMEKVSLYILHHHENYNGTGYPAGLKGEGTPLGARIITILDCFDAMTHDRSYRKALSLDRALAELKKYSGEQFDPELVELFTEYILFTSQEG
ncbi:MAG: HD-GYP domain-containing protein [Acidobacteriia bacterium]|nr:HD-GYP domain-containing protein [Terriglobia bacterium]